MDLIPIPPTVSQQVPQLVIMVLVVGAILAFVRWLWGEQSKFFDRWMTRHEAAEKDQMAVVERSAIAADRVADSVDRLVERLGQGYPTPSNSQENMSHSIASPGQPHLGVPGGVFEPDVTFSLNHIRQSGETAAWTIARYGINTLHERGVRGRGAQVVVIDTGVDRHPDLVQNLDLTNSRNFVPGETIQDVNGHHTHCAGIVAADDNTFGVRGVAPDATVTGMKALSNRGSGDGAWLAGAIRAAADLPGHRILSCSFGANGEDRRISDAVRYARSKGHWIVAAAGNSGPGSINWPGALPEVICVGALDQNDRVANFSSANDFVDVGFGGVQILSTIPGGRYARYDGTSMATPGVAGVLALAVGELLKVGAKIPDQEAMTEVLYACCKDVGVPGRDPGAGYGLPDVPKFIEEMLKRFGPQQPPVGPPVDPPTGKVFTVDVAKLKAEGYTAIGIRL